MFLIIIGVLWICWVKLNVCVSVLFEVFLFVMIFKSGILLIGEKKCRFIKFFGFCVLDFNCVIGSVEVFEF